MRAAALAGLTVAALLAPATRAEAAQARVLEVGDVPGLAPWLAWPGVDISPMPPPFVRTAPPPFVYTGSGGCSQGFVHDLIVAQPWDDGYALYVADRESNCLASAYNSTPWPPGSSCHASGVFQILTGGSDCDNWSRWSASCGFAGASVFDAVANVETAACVVASGGWGPWAL